MNSKHNRRNYKQGIYEIINKDKYVGKKVPTYRSGLEAKICYSFDNNPNVIEWASEPFAIQYSYRTKQGSLPEWKLYVVDFYVKIKVDGKVDKYLIEVKPHSQTVKPVPPKINNKKAQTRYENELVLFNKNYAKWSYAYNFCVKHDMKFKILTERDINGI